MQECTFIGKKGYYVKRKHSYYTLIADECFKNDPNWVLINDPYIAPVGKDFNETLQLIREYKIGDENSKVPLLFTDLSWENNSTITYIGAIKDQTTAKVEKIVTNEQEQITERQSEENLKFMRPIPSCSIIRNAIPGFQLMMDKYVLAKLLSRSKYSVPSIFIGNNRRVPGNAENTEYGIDDKIWYLKDPLKNKGEGITLVKGFKEAVELCDPLKRYILQKEVIPLLLDEKYKFDIRIMVVLYFTTEETKLFLFNEGIVRSTSTEYQHNSLERSSQLTNFCYQIEVDPNFDNIHPLSQCERENRFNHYGESFFEKIKVAVGDIFSLFIQKLNTITPKNQGFTVLGLDFIFDRNTKTPQLLEMNLSPSMFQKSKESIADICKRFTKQLPGLFIDPLVNKSPQPLDTGDFIEVLKYQYIKQEEDINEEEINLF